MFPKQAGVTVKETEALQQRSDIEGHTDTIVGEGVVKETQVLQ
jgi:hypothetical protein